MEDGFTTEDTERTEADQTKLCSDKASPISISPAIGFAFCALSAVYFCFTGSTLAMFLGLASPGKIFFISAVLLCGTALLWLFMAPIAACASLPLVLGLTFMLYRYPFGTFRVIYGLAFAGCYVLIALAFRYSNNERVLVPSSAVLTVIWFSLYWRSS